MPRGRHRHSPPLHRLLPPIAVAGASVVCAAGAWLLTDPVVLRTLVAAAAAAAVTGAVLMRTWDRAAGLRVADLTRGRASDAWQTEERTAELEAQLDDARELRTKAEAKLRTKRVELAALRGEHADLLRRYATAETERAGVLEDRRRLVVETAATPATAGASDPAGRPASDSAGAPGSPAGPAPAAPRALPPAGAGLTAAAFLRAAKALDDLARTAAAQRTPAVPGQSRERTPAVAAGEADESRGKLPAGAGEHTRPAAAVPARRSLPSAERPAIAAPAPVTGPDKAPVPTPAPAAIVPYGPARRPAQSKQEGGFDFFGTQAPGTGGAGGVEKAIEAAQQEDLADVVGEEALAERRPQAPAAPAPQAAPAAHTDPAPPAAPGAVGDVIDLTAHDETEKLDLGGLRNAVGS
ncbi:hypothetical protein [Streptomyces sp. CAU 1734]|uniref:hypothetical protein n=1 Tax=Streptomyces sp. CAU 1734 TaxID=3140360 RepID=UPI003260AAB2